MPYGFSVKDLGVARAGKRSVSQLVIKCKDVISALAEIASKMAKHDINILSGSIITEPDEEIGVVTMFLDLTGLSITVDQIVKELRALDMVLDVRVVAREFSGAIVNMGTYVTTYLSRMFNWLDEAFGTGGHAILFNMGEHAVRPIVKELKERGLRGRELIEAFLVTNTIIGFYRYEIVEYDEEKLKFVIRLYENFECKFFMGKKDKPMGHMTRGALTAIFNEVYGKVFEVREVKCIAKGDEYCEFIISPR